MGWTDPSEKGSMWVVSVLRPAPPVPFLHGGGVGLGPPSPVLGRLNLCPGGWLQAGGGDCGVAAAWVNGGLGDMGGGSRCPCWHKVQRLQRLTVVDFGCGFGNDGQQPTLGNGSNEACAGVLGSWRKPCPSGPMTVMPSGVVYFLGSVHRSALSPCMALSFWV